MNQDPSLWMFYYFYIYVICRSSLCEWKIMIGRVVVHYDWQSSSLYVQKMDYPTITEALITPLIKLTSVFLQMCSSNSQCICNWMNRDQGSVSGTFRVYNLEFEHLTQKIFTLKTISVKIYVGDDFIISCCTLWNLKLWGDKLRQLFCCFLFYFFI